jgi:enoyl-CoA hydratase
MSNDATDTKTIVAGLAVTLADGVLSVTIDRPEGPTRCRRRCWRGSPRSNDFIEGATAFQQHRAANFTGS